MKLANTAQEYAWRHFRGCLAVADLGSYLNLAVDNSTMTEDILRVLGKRILDNAESLALDHGVEKVAKRIEDSKPVDVILEIAKSVGADLIITGARGLSNAKALVVDSVSHKVAQMSPVTCVTVHCPP
jgi:nucleotide-binding universal stress UspA family protein